MSQGEHGRQERVPDTEPDPNALSALDRVRQVARVDREARFTTRLHHVDVDRLPAAYWAIRPKAAPGVDGVTWQVYGQDLEQNLVDVTETSFAETVQGSRAGFWL